MLLFLQIMSIIICTIAFIFVLCFLRGVIVFNEVDAVDTNAAEEPKPESEYVGIKVVVRGEIDLYMQLLIEQHLVESIYKAKHQRFQSVLYFAAKVSEAPELIYAAVQSQSRARALGKVYVKVCQKLVKVK